MSALSPPDAETVERVVDHLSRSRSILFVTGAGMSADSGLPTYRGVGGLYDRGETEEGLAIEEMLSGPPLGIECCWSARWPLVWVFFLSTKFTTVISPISSTSSRRRRGCGVMDFIPGGW